MTREIKAPINLIFKTLFIVLLGVGPANSFAAGIYKWVDEDGMVHYGQQRPNNTASKSMDVQLNAPVNTSTYNRSSNKAGKQPDNTAQKAPRDNTEPKKKKETKAEKKRRLAACVQARNNLTAMQSIGRIRAKDKDGNTSYLSQKQKEEKMKKTQDLIDKHCK